MRARFWLLTIALAGVVAAQEPNEQKPADGSADRAVPIAAPPRTRAEEIEQLRREKAQKLAPDVPPRSEEIVKTSMRIANDVFGGWNGLHLVIGGLYPRSGFAVGPEYRNNDLFGGRMAFRTSARASAEMYEKADIELAFPHIASDHVYIDLLGVYRNYPAVDYYGPGPNSAKTGRSDYRLEDGSADFTAGVVPIRFLRFGVTGGYYRVNVGPGTDTRFVSADRIYTELQAPGIRQQTDFLRGGPFVAIDYRDRPGDPHSGGLYEARYTYYDDQTLGRYNFKRLVGDVEQYIPFLNRKRVIALRGKTELSYRNSKAPIPFFLQPTLGGSEDLRGYRVFRYYGDNSLLLQSEYRWEVMTGFDMAVFVDSGKVFQSKSQLNLADMRTDAGFGLRFSNKQNVFMRWDVGFSREGFQVWLKFGNVF